MTSAGEIGADTEPRMDAAIRWAKCRLVVVNAVYTGLQIGALRCLLTRRPNPISFSPQLRHLYRSTFRAVLSLAPKLTPTTASRRPLG